MRDLGRKKSKWNTRVRNLMMHEVEGGRDNRAGLGTNTEWSARALEHRVSMFTSPLHVSAEGTWGT